MANLYHSLAFDNHQESWTVRPRTSHRQTGYIEDGTYWVEVKSVESRSFEGTVYNFETKRTHTYTAELLGVHNCTKKEIGFKEYHYPSQVNPEFTPEAEALFREVYSDAAYDHEILAEFGEAEMGVFTQKHIDACVERLAYSYKDCNPPRAGMQVRDLPPTIMGVDWNETAGIHIVIVVYDSEVDAFKMVHKSVVHSKKATQIAGLQKIIDLNKYWRPDYIYVDKGAGTTNIELLHRYGAENPTTKLHKIVKGVGFGEKIEVKDPFVKGKVEKKPVKPLVVNIACRRVEDHMCLFPVEEDFEKEMDDAGAVRKTLLGQMRNFIIERYNQSGMPIYSQGDEHTLIAWMLCIFGFIVEFTDTLMMGKSRLIDVRIAGNFGEKGGRMFQEAKQRAAKEKRKRLVVPPRWHSVGGVFGLFASSSGYHPRNYASDKAKVQQRLTKSASRGRAQLPGRHIGRRTMGGPGKRTTF